MACVAVGGYYEEGGAGAGYCGEYARCGPLPPHASHASHAPHATHAPHPPHPTLDHQHACEYSRHRPQPHHYIVSAQIDSHIKLIVTLEEDRAIFGNADCGWIP